MEKEIRGNMLPGLGKRKNSRKILWFLFTEKYMGINRLMWEY